MYIVQLIAFKLREIGNLNIRETKSMVEQVEWKYCDCDDEEEKHCGCEKEHPDNKFPIHWREEHWRWECAFQVLLEENDEMRRRLVKMAVDKIFQRRKDRLQDFREDDQNES